LAHPKSLSKLQAPSAAAAFLSQSYKFEPKIVCFLPVVGQPGTKSGSAQVIEPRVSPRSYTFLFDIVPYLASRLQFPGNGDVCH
jgi:hypothetical protein